MGTDIHLYVERRDGDKWVSCDAWEPDSYEPNTMSVPYKKHFYSDRNYDVFAILADVRNGRGFAGVDTGDGFVPLVQPRGLPDDLSPELHAEAEASLDHTPSWVTVQELMDYDWTRTTNKRGVVSAVEYAQWAGWRRGAGKGPESYCGGISGRDIKHITEEEMAVLVRDTEKAVRAEATDHPTNGQVRDIVGQRLKNLYCQVSWTEPYYEAASNFLSECLPKLWRLGKPENVRIVFWFDS